MGSSLRLCLVLLGFGLASRAEARMPFVDAIPNAPEQCNTCHTRGGGTARNPFGLAVEASLTRDGPDWPAVCPLDSDGDGASNGLELADPECRWRPGDPRPTGAISPPGKPHPPMDAGEPDTGPPPDLGIDGGLAPSPDAGLPDLPSTTPTSEGGCICGQRSSGAPWALLIGFALILAIRRVTDLTTG